MGFSRKYLPWMACAAIAATVLPALAWGQDPPSSAQHRRDRLCVPRRGGYGLDGRDHARRHGPLQLPHGHEPAQRRVRQQAADVVHADRGRHVAARAAAALVHAGPRLGRRLRLRRRPGTYEFRSGLNYAMTGTVIVSSSTPTPTPTATPTPTPTPTPTADADAHRRDADGHADRDADAHRDADGDADRDPDADRDADEHAGHAPGDRRARHAGADDPQLVPGPLEQRPGRQQRHDRRGRDGRLRVPDRQRHELPQRRLQHRPDVLHADRRHRDRRRRRRCRRARCRRAGRATARSTRPAPTRSTARRTARR